jgi:hypothetical protein
MRKIATSFPLLVQAALGQAPSGLAFASDDPALDALVARLVASATAAPDPAAPPDVAASARRVLGYLRAGQLDAARAEIAPMLAHAAAEAAPIADVCWALLALGWCVAAGDDDVAARSSWALLRPLLARLADAPASPRFADECLVIQAQLAAAAIARHAGTKASPWTDRAAARIDRLERVALQRLRGRFRSALDDGLAARAVHAPAEVRDLEPGWLGLALTLPSLQRHHRATLAELARRAETSPDDDTVAAAALRVVVAADLRERADLSRAFAALRRLGAGPLSPSDAALALDALLFALTGVRQATDFTLDGGFVLASPWLPPGIDRLAVRGVVVAGGVFDFDCDRRTGRLRPDETDATACLGDDLPRVATAVTLRSSQGGEPRLVVVHGAWQAPAHELEVGERWLSSLPTPQLDAQHEPR